MAIRAIIFGVAITAILMGVLVMTRLMVHEPDEKVFEITEISVASEPEPPTPEPEEVPPEDAPPPPPSVADLQITQDVARPAMMMSELKFDPSLSVETFFSDTPPSPIAVPKPAPKPKAVAPPAKPKSKASPKPRSTYSVGELDSAPRLLHAPSITYPSALTRRGVRSVRVTVEVEIDTSGRTRLVGKVNSPHRELIPQATRIANGSRFTVPTHKGKPVKVRMRWPITIK